MSTVHTPNANSTPTDFAALADKAVTRVRRWLRLSADTAHATGHPMGGLTALFDGTLSFQRSTKTGLAGLAETVGLSRGSKTPGGANRNAHEQAQEKRLAAVLSDPQGLAFTSGFVDRVIRIEDAEAAAQALTDVAHLAPDTMPLADRAQIQAGAALAQTLPDVVIPVAKARLRQMVGHMVVDARPKQFGETIAKLKQGGHRLNINLLGEAVLGEEEADNHLQATHDLLARDDVDYVSVKVSSIASRINLWAYDQTVEYVVDRLRPLYRQALSQAGSPEAAARGAKFINLDMEEYRDLGLTLDVFERLMAEEEFHNLEAGIVIQAYLPDALAAVQRLATFATQRVDAGGAGIKVRLVKGANLAMEIVHADIADWPLTVYPTKEDTDANYKRVLAWTLTPENTRGLRLGVAGHNLFDIAFAHELATQRGVQNRVEFEMLQGMATKQSHVVSQDVGDLLLYVPAVHPDQFDAAVSYLVRRLEENTAPQNFMSDIFEIANGNAAFREQESRFRDSVAQLSELVATDGNTPPAPNRTQDRTDPTVPAGTSATPTPSTATFVNEPDTDISLPANQAWARGIIDQATQPGWLDAQPIATPIDSEAGINALVETAATAADQGEWRQMGARKRLAIFERAAEVFAAKRGQFLAVMAAEAGKVLSQSDPEISEAIDFIRYYARRAVDLEDLQHRDNVRFEPDRVVVITPPWNFPVAIPTGGTVAALAVGASAILKPAGATARCGALIAECLWEAGVPRDVLQLAPSVESELGRALLAHPEVDRVVLTGASETAALFKSFRADLNVNAETSGKNAIVVTPSADRDLAVADLVYSAFGHAGQKCSAASLGILVGSVYDSQRYRKQLVDAVQSLVVDVPANLRAEMGPLSVDASDKLTRALTTLEPGEEWLVEPRRLDETGRLWSPGVKIGVEPGSFFHLTECFGPVLGLMRADNLAHAIDMQNQVDYGLTAGIHSLDAQEVATWLAEVEAGNVYVNRGITGAIVQRQPFGGWKLSSVGLGSKAGGPNYLMMFGRWTDAENSAGTSAWLDAARASDQLAWETEFGVPHDPTGLAAEANIFRYLPRFTTLRVSAGALDTGAEVAQAAMRRCAQAAVQVGAAFAWSIDPAVFDKVSETVNFIGADLGRELMVPDATVQTEEEFATDVASGAVDDTAGARVRMIGPVEPAVVAAAAKRPEVAVITEPITASGRVEQRYYLHEQAISMTLHRFGNPDRAFVDLAARLMQRP